MKVRKLLLIIVFSSFSIRGFAQVNYENTYIIRNTPIGQEFFLTNLGNNNYKYVVYDYDSARFSLYNLNHTPFMLNIQTPVMSDTSISAYYRLGYITLSLFDCDSTNIEYAMMLDHPSPAMHPNFGVYRTDGTLIFSKDTVGTVFCVGCGSGSYELHPIMNTPAGAKIYLFNYNVSGYVQYLIYGLCGTLPESITEISQSDSYVKVFPNPSSKQITFHISAPSHFEKYELTIFNSSFQVIKTIEIFDGTMELNLDNSPLSSGAYFYSLQNKSKVFQTGKFILSK